jgi:hypothetical protein
MTDISIVHALGYRLHNKCDYVEQPIRNELAPFSFVPHRIGESTTTKVVDIINQI